MGRYLYRITDNGMGHVLWTANTRDAQLYLQTQTQGNSLVTTQAFSPDTGMVRSIQRYRGTHVST